MNRSIRSRDSNCLISQQFVLDSFLLLKDLRKISSWEETFSLLFSGSQSIVIWICSFQVCGDSINRWWISVHLTAVRKRHRELRKKYALQEPGSCNLLPPTLETASSRKQRCPGERMKACHLSVHFVSQFWVGFLLNSVCTHVNQSLNKQSDR